MLVNPRLNQIRIQYADEVATGINQNRLGQIVTRLVYDLNAKIPQEELKKLKAEDANFLERFMVNPKYAMLVARYPWAPIAAEANKPITSKVYKETTTMSNSDNASLITTIYDNLGVAAGSIVYADGPIDFEHVRSCLREARFGSGLVGINQKAFEAVKQICSSVYHNNPIQDPRLVLEEVTHVGVKPAGEVFNQGRLMRLNLLPEEAGNGETRYVYFIVGISRKPADGSARRGEMVVHSAKTNQPKTVATARLGAQLPREVREDVAKREWPAYVEPEQDNGRPRRKHSGKGKGGKGGNRNERRYQ